VNQRTFHFEELPVSDSAVDELLSRPTPELVDSLQKTPGDIAILGVGGKMGPTLAMMARRALDQLGSKDKVIGVARFSNPEAQRKLEEANIETVKCDLLEPAQVAQLPPAANVIFMAGHKFGASSSPDLTWAMNVMVPAYAAQQYPDSKTVVFSTGCVYPLVPIKAGGAREETELAPPGDYANSCVGRERIFSYYSNKNNTHVALFRLNYAIDFRYGVLMDVAQKVWNGEPLDVSMGHANVIWQGDANARALMCLEHATSPASAFNITGPETISLRSLAVRFGQLLDRQPNIIGEEAATAWLSDASKSNQLFGYPHVSLDEMTSWVAQYLLHGGSTLGKPTHFEEREGKF
jgi:hypothetical protein